MIEIPLDDVSTHKIPEQNLISAVIAMAVRDSVLPPIKDGKHLRLTWDAMTAHDFLWTESLDSYLHWLDVDANYFRTNLIKTMDNDKEEKIGILKPLDRRAFRINKKLWDIEHDRLGGRVASDGSKNWSSVEVTQRKEQSGGPELTRRYSNGIEAIVQFHQAFNGE